MLRRKHESGRAVRPGPSAKVKRGLARRRLGRRVLLAERWDNAQDLAGWWLSEKLDGVRAYWDGKSLISRLGNRFHAPDWFLEGLPEIPLDGELWIGRKAFQRTVGIVRRQDQTELWKQVRYVAFDAPGVRRRVRGADRGDPRTHRAIQSAVPDGPRARCLHRPGPPSRRAGARRGPRR